MTAIQKKGVITLEKIKKIIQFSGNEDLSMIIDLVSQALIITCEIPCNYGEKVKQTLMANMVHYLKYIIEDAQEDHPINTCFLIREITTLQDSFTDYGLIQMAGLTNALKYPRQPIFDRPVLWASAN